MCCTKMFTYVNIHIQICMGTFVCVSAVGPYTISAEGPQESQSTPCEASGI